MNTKQKSQNCVRINLSKLHNNIIYNSALIFFAESFVPYMVQVFASTIAGTSSAVSTMIFTSHGGIILLGHN